MVSLSISVSAWETIPLKACKIVSLPCLLIVRLCIKVISRSGQLSPLAMAWPLRALIFPRCWTQNCSNEYCIVEVPGPSTALHAGGSIQVEYLSVILAEFQGPGFGYKASFYQIFLKYCCYPLRILYISFTSRRLPDEIGIDQFYIKLSSRTRQTGTQ